MVLQAPVGEGLFLDPRPFGQDGLASAEVDVDLRTVLARTGLGRSTLYAMMDRGEFPRPLKLGVRAVGWRESDLTDWLAARPRTNA